MPLLLPASTFNLMHTDAQEFLRRAEVHRREQFGPHDILAPIGDSASEFARLDGADLDGVDGGGDGVGDGDVSLTTRMLGHRPQSRRSSGSSGETVRASKSLHRRRRVTQRRYGDNETADPLPPPAAPSPRPNDVCPANLPVYPPTLINSVSGASVRRNAGNAAQGNAASRISSSSESQSMRRPTPLGARSVSSVSRQGEFDGRHGDSENERLLGEEQRGGYRRVSQNHEGDQGQASTFPFPLIPCAYPLSLSLSFASAFIQSSLLTSLPLACLLAIYLCPLSLPSALYLYPISMYPTLIPHTPSRRIPL